MPFKWCTKKEESLFYRDSLFVLFVWVSSEVENLLFVCIYVLFPNASTIAE